MNELDSMNTSGRTFLLVPGLMLVLFLAACASPKPAAKPAAATPLPSEPVERDPSVTEPHVSYCRNYADQMAGRELQRDYDSMEGRFRGGESQVFRDFAKMSAEKSYRRIYENCIRSQITPQKKKEAPAK